MQVKLRRIIVTGVLCGYVQMFVTGILAIVLANDGANTTKVYILRHVQTLSAMVWYGMVW